MRRYMTCGRWCALTLLPRQASRYASLAVTERGKAGGAPARGGVHKPHVETEPDAGPVWASQAAVSDIFAAPSTSATRPSRARFSLASFFLVLGTALLCGGGLVRYVVRYKVILAGDPHVYAARVKGDCVCDYAVLEGRWSGRRRVVQAGAAAAAAAATTVAHDERSSSCSRTSADDDDTSLTSSAHPPSRVLRVNRLKDKLWLYSLPERNVALLDLGPVLSPYRFVTKTHVGGHKVAAPVQTASSDDDDTSGAVGAGGVLRMTSLVRPKAVKSAPRQGLVVRYERMLQDVAARKLTERYRAYLLQHRVDPGVRSAWAQTLLEQGNITGHGVTLSTLVPDLASFAREVWDEVNTKMGRDMVVQDCVMSWLPQSVQRTGC